MSVLSTFEKPAEMFSSKLGYKIVAINFKSNLNHMDTTFSYCSNDYSKERDGDERYTIRLYINK